MATFQGSVDTAANWAAATRVPALFEFCYASDSKVLKIGDGTNTWANLPQYGGGSVLIAEAELVPSSGGQFAISPGATNIGSISFTVPASGKIQITARIVISANSGANSAQCYANLAFGSTSSGTDYGIAASIGYTSVNYGGSFVANRLISGLTPGATATVYFTAVIGTYTTWLYSNAELEVYSA